MEPCGRCETKGYIYMIKWNVPKKTTCPVCEGAGYLTETEAEEEAEYSYMEYKRSFDAKT